MTSYHHPKRERLMGFAESGRYIFKCFGSHRDVKVLTVDGSSSSLHDKFQAICLSEKNKLPKSLINHWISLANTGMSSVCEQLKDFGITYVLYVKRFRDGSQIELTNHIPWSEYYYKNAYHSIGPFEHVKKHYDNGTFLWLAMPYQEIYQNLREYFHIDHGITYVFKREDCNEFFHFAGSKDNHSLINFYLSNTNVLKQFMLYFKDKLADLIKSAEKTRLILPQAQIAVNTNDVQLPDFNSSEFLSKKMPINRYYICENTNLYITKRESECLKWHVLGKSAHEISLILNISQRTAETHLENAKQKLNCYKQSQLGYKLAELINLL